MPDASAPRDHHRRGRGGRRPASTTARPTSCRTPGIDVLAAALARRSRRRQRSIVGRDGRLCAGFDLAVMSAPAPTPACDLVAKGGELLMRLFLHPQPVVVAVTGHALAAGALLVLSRRAHRRRARQDRAQRDRHRHAPTLFAIALAEDRLDRRHLVRATVTAEVFDPAARRGRLLRPGRPRRRRGRRGGGRGPPAGRPQQHGLRPDQGGHAGAAGGAGPGGTAADLARLSTGANRRRPAARGTESTRAIRSSRKVNTSQ